MESLKRKMWGEDLYDSMSGVIKRHKLPWITLANITTDGLPNLIGKKRGVAHLARPLCRILKSMWSLSHKVCPSGICGAHGGQGISKTVSFVEEAEQHLYFLFLYL